MSARTVYNKENEIMKTDSFPTEYDFSKLDEMIDKKIEFDKTHPCRLMILKGYGLVRLYGSNKEIDAKIEKLLSSSYRLDYVKALQELDREFPGTR